MKLLELRHFNTSSILNSDLRKRMKRKRRFSCNPPGEHRGRRLIAGFLLWIGEDKYGDRSNGWLMFTRDHPGEL